MTMCMLNTTTRAKLVMLVALAKHTTVYELRSMCDTLNVMKCAHLGKKKYNEDDLNQGFGYRKG